MLRKLLVLLVALHYRRRRLSLELRLWELLDTQGLYLCGLLLLMLVMLFCLLIKCRLLLLLLLLLLRCG
jgi:hypothetical protein